MRVRSQEPALRGKPISEARMVTGYGERWVAADYRQGPRSGHGGGQRARSAGLRRRRGHCASVNIADTQSMQVESIRNTGKQALLNLSMGLAGPVALATISLST